MKSKRIALMGLCLSLCLAGSIVGLSACESTNSSVSTSQAKEVVSIDVDVSKAKTEYVTQEPLDTSNIVITVTYSDGSKETIDPDDCEFTGFDSSMPTIDEPQVITVSYEGKTDSYEITIKAPEPELPEGLFSVDIPGVGVFTFIDEENWEITFTGVFAAMAPGGPFTGTCSYEDGTLTITSANSNITIDEVIINADGSAIIKGTNVMLAQYGSSFGLDGKFTITLTAEQVKLLTGGETPTPTPGGGEGGDVDAIVLTIPNTNIVAAGTSLTLDKGNWTLVYAGMLASVGGVIDPVTGTYTYTDGELDFTVPEEKNITFVTEATSDDGLKITVTDVDMKEGASEYDIPPSLGTIGVFEFTMTADQVAKLG